MHGVVVLTPGKKPEKRPRGDIRRLRGQRLAAAHRCATDIESLFVVRQSPRRLAQAISCGFPRLFRGSGPFTFESHYILKCLARDGALLVNRRKVHRNRREIERVSLVLNRIDPCDDTNEKEEK